MFELETMLAVAGAVLVGLALFYLRADDVQDDTLDRLARTPAMVEEGKPVTDPAAEIRALAGNVALTEPSVSELQAMDPTAEIEALADELVGPAAVR